jgi:two-component system, chemotaxis family, chemotaxis protein CheY
VTEGYLQFCRGGLRGDSVDNKSATILIVDDNGSMRTVIRHILENDGYRDIIEAHDGASALGIMKRRRIDLIISDWNMFGMTGIELLKKVRSDRDVGRTPFLMLTVEGLEVSRDEAFAHGVSDFISKPFKSRDLLDAIARVREAGPEKLPPEGGD